MAHGVRTAKWSPPPGYDRLIILASGFRGGPFNRLIGRAPHKYLVGWPLADYLTALRWTPVMFTVASDGTFEHYWFYENRSGIYAASASLTSRVGR